MSAYNEERTIMKVVHSIMQARFPCEVELIIVDDGSSDATPDLLKEIDDPRVIVHRHAKNSGKGAEPAYRGDLGDRDSHDPVRR